MEGPDSIPVRTLEYRQAPALVAVKPATARWADRVLVLADRHRHKLFAILLVIYLLGFNAQWRLEPDSALYLTIGRNLAEGKGYTYQGEQHDLVFPGLPVLFAATFKLFHSEKLAPALVMMLLIGLATLGLTYRLFLLHAGRPTAVLITFGLGISRLFYRYCFELLSDMPFLLGVMAFLVGYEAVSYRRRTGARLDEAPCATARWFDYALMAIGLAVAVAMRPAMWALLAAVVLALGWSIIRGRERRLHLAILAVVIAAALLFWRYDLRNHGSHELGQYEEEVFEVTISHFGNLLHQMFFQYIPRLFESTLCKSLFGAPIGPGLNTLVGIAILLLCVTMLRHRPLWLLWIGMTVLMVLVAIKPLDRYFLEVLPLLIYAWWRGIHWLNHRLPQPWANWVFGGLLVLGAATNLSRGTEFVIEQRRIPFRDYYKEGRFASTDRVVGLLKSNVPPGDIVLAPPKFARILTFLSRAYVREPVMPLPRDAARRPVYVLAPLEDPVLHWLQEHRARLDKPVGAAVRGKLDPNPWQLYTVAPIH